jgi:hypothetical protein
VSSVYSLNVCSPRPEHQPPPESTCCASTWRPEACLLGPWHSNGRQRTPSLFRLMGALMSADWSSVFAVVGYAEGLTGYHLQAGRVMDCVLPG